MNARIALLGNCQATTLHRVFKVLAPSVEVVRFLFSDLPARFASREDLFEELARFDAIFGQPFGPGLFPELQGLMLKERFRDSFYFYPVIDFNAFHPDCVYLWHRGRSEYFKSPIGDYHSAIAFLGYSLGLTAVQTLSLFDSAVFERLGYFRFWNVSEEVLLKRGRLIGFPLERAYRSWVRRGSFMSSVNHPKIFVLADVARILLNLSGFSATQCNVEDYLPDEALFDAVWPIYPEIGEAMGIEGDYIFKCGCRSDEWNPFYSLQKFVTKSFELYGSEAPGTLECQRFEEWRKDAALIEFVRGKESWRTKLQLTDLHEKH